MQPLSSFFIPFIFLFISFSFEETQICNQKNWKYTGIDAIDVGMSPEGDLYVIGIDNRIYIYDQVFNTYSLVHADNEVPEPTKITVNDEGTPFVVANCGDIYFLTFYHHWEKIPGCATDIAVGRGGEVWKLGCLPKENGGYSVSKLSCDSPFSSPVINVEREFVRFRKDKSDSIDNFINYELLPKREKQKKCYWIDIDGEGTRIAVGPKGEPYIIAPGGVVMKFENPNWTGIYGQAALDLAISNEGIIFTAGVNGNIMRSVVEEMGTWIQIDGTSAMAITAGPFSQPVVASFFEGKVMTTTILV